jgi:hypothetical protein
VNRSGLLACCAGGSGTSSLARIAVAMHGLAYAGGARMDLSEATGHQRKSFCVKGLVGASSVVCPCIAVMGLVPSSV